ncbi:MAG: ABC transporter ATP-binding protein [Clostridiales bacterium]|nr:energy-coupling factor ABC transporter ATP-binding protein [Lachnospiraceae bacterium]MDD6616968.1 ABC transporter ATP-binding protein [Clostridiales bacterium]
MSHIRINFEHVNYSYEKSVPILRDVTFSAHEHESIGLIGANGVGKSTLLKLLVGLNLGYEGTISVEGMKVEKQILPKIRERIGYVFQDSDSQLFMSTAYEDIAFGPRNYGLSEPEVQERVENALSMIHIEHLKNKQIYKMSGGEKKMVSIATILAMTPDIILMDEPSIALDPRNRRYLIQILNQFHHLKIIASHDLDMILDTCSRVILMAGGTIIRDGKAEEILSDKELLEANGLELPLCMQRR